MPIDLSHVNWSLWILIGLVALVGWTIIRFLLRLTMRMFAIGCVGLLVLGGVILLATRFVH